ncbi:MAG: tyrosine-type recombinase/integrase [Candidatus Omnitrophota bacterium]|nr:tyrosine-type recombinase/integrase [Candidatus Omnitrophota bacterium]
MSIRKRGENYFIDYYYKGKRQREMVGSNRKLAEIILKKRETEIAENKHLDIKKNYEIKFEDFADEFTRLHVVFLKPSTQKSNKSILKTLKRYFGGLYLYNIGPKDIEMFKAERIKAVKKSNKALLKTLKPATINRNVALLKCLFNKAVAWGKADKNPLKGMKPLKENNKRLRFLEKNEILKLIDCCSPHLKPIVIVAVNTGMRTGEILNLKWNDLDYKRNLLYLIETKNNEKREIPMSDIVKKTLIKVLKHPDSPYIFCNKNGKPYESIKTSFHTAMKRAGIENFRFHDLRGTFASHLVMLGIDLRTVQELLGHKSFEMVLRYSHLSPSHKSKAVELLEKNIMDRGSEVGTNWARESDNELIRKAASFVTVDN